MTIITEGSRWTSNDQNQFVVLHVIDYQGNTWVHYRQDQIIEPIEYSCYVESFLQRFTQVS